MEPKEKIKAPAGWLAERDKEAQRRELVGKWRRYLSDQQRKALDEKGASAGFKSRLPIDAIKSFTPEEVDGLMAHEQAEYNRFRPLAEARSTQRTAWVKAGGDEEDFDAGWDLGGRENTIAEIASGGKFEPSPGQYTSAYE